MQTFEKVCIFIEAEKSSFEVTFVETNVFRELNKSWLLKKADFESK